LARDAKIEVAVVNVRISEDFERDYTGLIELIASLRRGVKVRGDTYLAISYFEPKTGVGVFSKYTEIDIDGNWFDLGDFEAATPDKLGEINIPENLRPNLSQFWFLLNPKLHVIAFSSYSESRALSARSVERFLRESANWREVIRKFGVVEIDVVKSYDGVEKILDLPKLKELELIIKRPNSDDVGDDLARVIEERLKGQNADVYEESLKAKGAKNIEPNERTRKLALVAAENGQVRARSLVNGVMTPADTEDIPLVEVEKYKSDEAESSVFSKVANRIFDRIRQARNSIRE
jgi:hypothetical protein